MRLIIIRHGESEGNIKRIIQGAIDYPLTTSGKTQAENVAQWVQTQDVDAIYTSPASRAHETAIIIGHITGIPIIADERLRPINLGMLEGLPMEGLEPDKNTVWQDIKRMKETHAHGGESVGDVVKRAESFLHELTREPSENVVCVVTHNMTKRALVKVLLNISLEESAALRFPNTAVSVFDVAAGMVNTTQVNVLA